MSGTEMSQKKTTNSTLLKLSILCVAALNNVMGSATSVLGSIASVFPDASYQVVAMISTIPPLLMSVVPFFYTPLITHVKKRTVLWIASVLILVGGLGPAVLHDNIYVILGFRIILGFAVGLTTVLSIDLIMDFFDGKEQNTLTGFRDTFNSIGGAIFMLLGGWLAGFQWYFCFLAVIVGIVFIAIPLAALPEPDRNAKMELEKEKLGADKVDVKIPAGVWVFSIFTLLHWAFFYVFITNVSLIVVSEAIASPAQCGIIYAFTNVGTIIFGLIFGKVFEKVKFVTFLIGMLCCALALFLAATSTTVPMFCLASALLGAGTGFFMPTVYAKNSTLIPYKNASKAVSIVSFMIGVGGFISPFVFGGFGLAGREQCILAAVLYVICGVAALVLALVIKPKANYDLSNYDAKAE